MKSCFSIDISIDKIVSSRSLALVPFVELYGQVNKRFRWMPWQLKAMKDVVACDKLRGVGKQTLLPVDFRMGKPSALARYLHLNI